MSVRLEGEERLTNLSCPFCQETMKLLLWKNLKFSHKVDDSIMRVLSKEIACELMEIIFGNNDNKDVV